MILISFIEYEKKKKFYVYKNDIISNVFILLSGDSANACKGRKHIAKRRWV